MWKKRLLQFSLFWLYALLSVGIPCILIMEKYKLFTDFNGTKVTIVGIFVGLLLLFFFRKHISKFIDGMPVSTLKSVLVATREMVPLLVFFGAFYGAKFLVTKELNDILFIIEWTCTFNILGYLVRIIHLRYRDKVNEDYNVGLMKKAINETK